MTTNQTDQSTGTGGTGRPMAVSLVGGLLCAVLGGAATYLPTHSAGLFVISLGGFSPSPALVGIGLLLLMAGSTAVRYLIQKRRG